MMGYNVQLALSGLRRFPKSTLLVVLTVALGLSACMTTLVLLHVLSADPLPGRSQHLYLAWADTVLAKPNSEASADMALNGITTADANAYRRIKLADVQALLSSRRAAAQAVVADMVSNETSDDGKHSESSQVILATSADFVPMFGVSLRYGRSWTPAEEAARVPVTLINTNLAKTLFGSANSVGRSVQLNKTLFRVIGVFEPYAPEPHFFGLNQSVFSSEGGENLYVPYLAALDAGLKPTDSDSCDAPSAGSKDNDLTNPKRCAALNVWVQLDTPQQVADYRQYLTHYAEQEKALASFGKQPKAQLFGVDEWLKLHDVVPQSVRLNVWLAASFLLLCMFNVAGLLAARFLHRSAEIGIRRALGAPRFSVFMQHVLEAGAVCVSGGVLALPLTLLGLWIMRHQGNEFSGLARLDPLMFGALFALALLVGVLVGVVPAWRASAVEPGLQIKSD